MTMLPGAGQKVRRKMNHWTDSKVINLEYIRPPFITANLISLLSPLLCTNTLMGILGWNGYEVNDYIAGVHEECPWSIVKRTKKGNK